MSVTIIHKHSETASATPAVETLQVGEIAVNTADKKWFTKTTANTVVCLNYLTLLDGGEIAEVVFELLTADGDAITTADDDIVTTL